MKKNRCGRFEPPVGGTEKRSQSCHKKHQRTITPSWAEPLTHRRCHRRRRQYKEWSGKGGVQPRGHKSSTREIEVNVQKRGTGPQGRGGKTITREQQLSLSESSESESEEGDEGLDGLYGIKRTKMVSRDELLAMLREKERTITKLQADVIR